MAQVLPKDLPLLVTAAADGDPLGPAHLQKTCFVLQERAKLPLAEKYAFIKGAYGPFCQDIFKDAGELFMEGLVLIALPISNVNPLRYASVQMYTPTRKGKEKAGEIRDVLDDNITEYIDLIVDWSMKMGFNELVRSVCKEFPEFKGSLTGGE